ncbi:MAG: energy-coupling factor transporter transmembrane protein EcfT [Acidimicrobiia bacterium]|nr:energy-coupling factor transporter transmembrane protein EcfT [Acidimicrobiia bacterium]
MATAASRTTNPLLLALLIAVVAQVVAARRTDAPWARGFKAYIILGLVVIAIRVVFRMLLDGQHGTHVLFTLPEIPLPEAAMGIRLGGPVSLEGVLAAFYDGLRLATLLICIGAANVLANPKRLLAAIPPALHEVGVAITVALTMAPQLLESGQRVRRAQRLRGDAPGRVERLRRIVVPVLTDALDRSLLLAAAMDSRGYGRRAQVPTRTRLVVSALVLAGLAGVAVGTYGLLDATTPAALGLPVVAVGLLLAGVGLSVGGRGVRRTRYRPDPWRAPEWGVATTGALVAVALVVIGGINSAGLHPSVQPLEWPTLPPLATLAILVGLLPAVLAPPVRPPTPRRRVAVDSSAASSTSTTGRGARASSGSDAASGDDIARPPVVVEVRT